MTPGGYGPPPGGGQPPWGQPPGGYGPPGAPPPGAPPPGGYGYGPPGAPMGQPPMGAPPMGAPAYQPAPSPPPKKGPPIALLVGGGCGLLAVIGVVLLLVLVVGAASASGDDTPSTGSGPATTPSTPSDVPDAMDGAVFKGVPQTNVEVPVPPGWREAQRGLYTFALSGDGDAVLAFTTVSSAGEFAGRLQHASREFNITNCNMKDAERVRIGPNQLRGRLREGDCSFNNVPSHVAVVLVDSQRNALPLVIYAVDLKASRRTTVQAQQTIARMRTR